MTLSLMAEPWYYKADQVFVLIQAFFDGALLKTNITALNENPQYMFLLLSCVICFLNMSVLKKVLFKVFFFNCMHFKKKKKEKKPVLTNL